MEVASPARLNSAAFQARVGTTGRCSLKVSASIVRMVDNRRPVEISETVASLSASRRQALLGLSTIGISLIASQSPSEASSRTAGRLKALERLKKLRESENTAVEEAADSVESAVMESTPAVTPDVPSSAKNEPIVADIEPPSIETSPVVESVEEVKTSVEELTENVVESVQDAGNVVESLQEAGNVTESVPEAGNVAESVTESVVESVAETPSEEKDTESKPSGVMDLKALIEKGKSGETGGTFSGKLTLSDFQ